MISFEKGLREGLLCYFLVWRHLLLLLLLVLGHRGRRQIPRIPKKKKKSTRTVKERAEINEDIALEKVCLTHFLRTSNISKPSLEAPGPGGGGFGRAAVEGGLNEEVVLLPRASPPLGPPSLY